MSAAVNTLQYIISSKYLPNSMLKLMFQRVMAYRRSLAVLNLA